MKKYLLAFIFFFFSISIYGQVISYNEILEKALEKHNDMQGASDFIQNEILEDFLKYLNKTKIRFDNWILLDHNHRKDVYSDDHCGRIRTQYIKFANFGRQLELKPKIILQIPPKYGLECKYVEEDYPRKAYCEFSPSEHYALRFRKEIDNLYHYIELIVPIAYKDQLANLRNGEPASFIVYGIISYSGGINYKRGNPNSREPSHDGFLYKIIEDEN